MRRWLRSLLSRAAHHNFLIAFTASLASISVYVLYHHPINFILGVEVFFATFFTYTIQRLFGLGSSSTEIQKWKILLLVFSGVVIIALAFLLSLTQVVLLGLAGSLSLLYALPVIPHKNSKKSLRQIPYLKIWVIVAVWIIVICLVPLSDFSSSDAGNLLTTKIIFIIQQGAFVFALTIPFDIRDLKEDESDQKTIPMILGVGQSVSLAKSALWLSFFTAGLNFLFGFFDLEIVFIQLFIVLIGLRLLHRSKSIQRNEFYLIQVDGLIAFQALLFLLSYFI